MFLGWVIIIILQQGPSQIMPAGQVGRPPKESPPRIQVQIVRNLRMWIMKKRTEIERKQEERAGR